MKGYFYRNLQLFQNVYYELTLALLINSQRKIDLSNNNLYLITYQEVYLLMAYLD
jgi:hypothetical protein